KQNSYINPVVSTATKSNVDPKDTPFTVNVINQQFLHDIRAESLSDAYGYTTGLSESGTNADSFSLRGIDT
ncbi:TonB-dependent receptor plug domain-containing protein, partial [Psychromonas aquatilis]